MQSAQFQLHADVEQRHWWFVARRQIVRSLVREMLPPAPDVQVVDVGCGTGGNIAAFAGDYRCAGIDTSSEAIEFAKQLYPNVQFQCGLAPNAAPDLFANARLVMLMDVLEHVPDDVALLLSLVAATEPGTLFLLTVPADPSLWSQHDESFGHYRRYEMAGFENVWSGLDVRPRMVSYFNSRLYPVVKAVRGLSRWRGHAAGTAGTDFRLPSAPVNRCCTALFASERRRLSGVLRGERSPFRRGVSLIALLERTAHRLPAENCRVPAKKITPEPTAAALATI